MTADDGERGTLDRASSLLVLAPEVRDATVGAFATLLATTDRPIDHVVPVTVGRSPMQWLVEWENRVASQPRRVTCVDVEDLVRSTAAPTSSADRTIQVRSVPDVTDLAHLGTAITDVVRDAAAADERAAVCVHSLTDLLQHADEQRVFNFVVTLADRAARNDAVVYFHLDSDGYDQETIDKFAATCDAVVELDGDVDIYER